MGACTPSAPRSENLIKGNLDRIQDLKEQLRAEKSIAYPRLSNWHRKQRGWTKVAYKLARVHAMAKIRELEKRIADLQHQDSAAVATRPQTTCLLVIDPQVDFAEGGSLAVKGATDDAIRLAKWIDRQRSRLDNITVSLDSHEKFHVGNAMFWADAEGNNPPPFTIITHDDVVAGTWKASKPELQKHVEDYTKKLETGESKFSVCVWPYHCIMDTPGHAIQPELTPALKKWSLATKRPVDYELKGQNPLTEMYSVFKAEVVLGKSTYDGAFNQALFDRVASYDRIVVAGQAKTHCVNYSMRDLVNALPEAKRKNVYLLSDCTSSIGGFEKSAEDLETFLKANGCNITTTKELRLV